MGNFFFLITARKIGLTQIYLVQIWCKKLQTRGKSKAEMVNNAFACQFTRGCKFEGKHVIYHLCPLFNLSLHFFASNLHWVNLVYIKFLVQCKLCWYRFWLIYFHFPFFALPLLLLFSFMFWSTWCIMGCFRLAIKKVLYIVIYRCITFHFQCIQNCMCS